MGNVMEKLVIFAALGYPGAANPALPAMPATWAELVESAVAARQAGASIVHFHGPHDEDGKIIPDAWGRVTEDIRKRSDVLIDFGQAGAPWEQRKPLLELGTGNQTFLRFPSPTMTTDDTILSAAITMSITLTPVTSWRSTLAAV